MAHPYAQIVTETYAALQRFRLKDGFCDGAPPSQEALARHHEAFTALQGKPWPKMEVADAPKFIDLVAVLSDAEFISAYPLIAEYLLSDQASLEDIHAFAAHLRAVSKGHLHRLLPYDWNALLVDLLEALQEKHAAALVKREETASNLRKTRDWAAMRINIKK